MREVAARVGADSGAFAARTTLDASLAAGVAPGSGLAAEGVGAGAFCAAAFAAAAITAISILAARFIMTI